jgi:hypothetical protein
MPDLKTGRQYLEVLREATNPGVPLSSIVQPSKE